MELLVAGESLTYNRHQGRGFNPHRVHARVRVGDFSCATDDKRFARERELAKKPMKIDEQKKLKSGETLNLHEYAR